MPIINRSSNLLSKKHCEMYYAEMDKLNQSMYKNVNKCIFTPEVVLGTEHNKWTNSLDVQPLIERISLTTDAKLLMNLFSILASNLITYPYLRESVVKCYVIYEKVSYLLSLGQPFKTATALNFLIILIYNDDDENLSAKQSATQYARNMIRVSGCLNIILQYFTSHMMHADTWKAACQCIVECCLGSDINQAHCSHLIPICIDKCKKGDVFTLPVLHALLQDNQRNCKYFVDSKGLDIFTRPLLCNIACVQLLAALVQQEPRAPELLKASSIPEHLIALTRTQGNFTKIREWCKVILYYIYGNLKVLNEDEEPTTTENSVERMKLIDRNNISLDSKFFEENHLNSTSTLLKNLMQEMFTWNKNNFSNFNKQVPPHVLDDFGNTKPAVSNRFIRDGAHKKSAERTEKSNCCANLSNITNIQQEFNTTSYMNTVSIEGRPRAMKHKNMRNKNNAIDTTRRSDNVFEATSAKSKTRFNYDSRTDDYEVFKPPTTSTPKPTTPDTSMLAAKISNRVNKTTHSTKNVYRHSYVHEYDTSLHRRAGVARRSRRRRRRRSPPVNTAGGRSMSAKIFNALNETCSTIVNAIKDMIMPWSESNTHTSKIEKATQAEIRSYNNFSFTNYMKERQTAFRSTTETGKDDASFGNAEIDGRNSISSSTENADGNVCKTCNDTLLLKRKLENNVYLKETLRKLKIGINLYGCDFKKMSKVMWRNETYMTPRVLYDLYQKLILK